MLLAGLSEMHADGTGVVREGVLWMQEMFPRIVMNLDRIMLAPKAFWSVPPGSRVAFSYGGSFPVPIGIWGLGWSKGFGVHTCEHCGGKALALCAGGTMSRGSSSGYCAECGRSWQSLDWSLATWSFLRSEIVNRIGGFDLMEGEFPEAYEFLDLASDLGSVWQGGW